MQYFATKLIIRGEKQEMQNKKEKHWNRDSEKQYMTSGSRSVEDEK
jgi:hypothetical protein